MIREATIEDIPQLVSLAPFYLDEHPLRAFTGIDTMSVDLVLRRMIEKEDGVVYVAQRKADVVGLLGAILYPLYFNVGYVLAVEIGFYVNRAVRHIGYGRDLLDSFEAWAYARGANATLTCSPTGKTSLERTYEDRGYEPFETHFIKRLR